MFLKRKPQGSGQPAWKYCLHLAVPSQIVTSANSQLYGLKYSHYGVCSHLWWSTGPLLLLPSSLPTSAGLCVISAVAVHPHTHPAHPELALSPSAAMGSLL